VYIIVLRGVKRYIQINARPATRPGIALGKLDVISATVDKNLLLDLTAVIDIERYNITANVEAMRLTTSVFIIILL
jgi:hypothetical protein